MLAAQSVGSTSLQQFPGSPRETVGLLPKMKQFDFTEIDVINGIDAPNNKAVVVKSSRHLSRDSASPQSADSQKEESTGNGLPSMSRSGKSPQSVKDGGSRKCEKIENGKTYKQKLAGTNVTMYGYRIMPAWPDREAKLPGTNLTTARNLRRAAKVATILSNGRKLRRRDGVAPRTKSAMNKDKAFMKIGNAKDAAPSGESDDDVGPLEESTRKLRRRLSLMTQQRQGSMEAGSMFGAGRLGVRQGRRLSRFVGLQGLYNGDNGEHDATELGGTTVKREVRPEIRKKFKAAGFMAVFSARLAIAYAKTTSADDIDPFAKQVQFKDDDNKSSLLDDSPYGFDPNKFKANRDMRISEETKRILCKPPWTRTDREIYHVEVLLRDIKAYADYPEDMQKKIAEVGQYRKYDAKRVIVREGHEANNFYFILSGSVVVLVMDEQRKYAKPVAYLQRGDSFGELAIIHGKRRQSTVVAKEKVEMLAIWFEDYLDIFMAGGVQNIYDPEQNSFITTVSILKHWPLKLLQGNENKFVFHFYKRGEIVVKDSNFSKWIIIVKSGSISVLKKLKRCEAFEWVNRKDDKNKERVTERAKQRQIASRSLMRRIVLPELQIELKTPDDSGVINYGDSGSDGEDGGGDGGDDNNNRALGGKFTSMDSLQSVETTDSQRTLIDPPPNMLGKDTEEDSEQTFTMTEFKQEIRTLAHDYDNLYKEKDPDEYTDADIDPQFVRVQTLTKGMYFGVAEFVFDKQPSLCVVSNGAECVLFDKQFYLEHAPQKCMTLIRKEVCPFPTDAEMQTGLQTSVDWQAFKKVTMKNAVSEIRARKAGFKDEKAVPPRTTVWNGIKISSIF